MEVNSYKQLKVWQSGNKIVHSIYLLTQKFPNHELYGLTSQMRRAAVSVVANIAEGHARDSTKEFLHHISIAIGSLAELETMILLSQELGYCKPDDLTELLNNADGAGKMLRGLQKSLKTKINSSP